MKGERKRERDQERKGRRDRERGRERKGKKGDRETGREGGREGDTYKTSTWKVRTDQSQSHSKFETNLGYMRPCL